MNAATTVLVVDDDEDLLQLLGIRLRRAGYAVETVTSAEAALRSMATSQPAVVVTDLRLGEMDGLGLLAEIKASYPVLPVIMMTAHGTIPDAVTATRQGAHAFITKPIDPAELIDCVRSATHLHGAVHADAGQPGNQAEWRSAIITRSSKMEALLGKVEMAAASEASIIIESDSGTGKELLARAIHAASPRAAQAFVTVNCTAIPDTLFESEVFGHVKGAFTDARRDRTGLFQQADLGTLFLDEVGDMPLAAQVRLLRAIQEGRVRPVGADQDVVVNVRVIAATHHDLAADVADGRFREDLYYRLNVIKLRLPTLAERREDIPLLANHFLRKYGNDGPVRGFSPEAMERLVDAAWPGNVRQLENVVQQGVALCRSGLIPESLVRHALEGDQGRQASFAEARERFEFEYLSGLLKTTGGNVAQAARLADRNRTEFYKLLARHGLDPGDFRTGVEDSA